MSNKIKNHNKQSSKINGESFSMRGVIVLSEGRSGSNWLGSLTTSTELLGVSKEWVDSFHMGVQPKDLSADEYIKSILDHASTDNGFFSIKMFPRHLHWFHTMYERDIISEIAKNNEIIFILLTRNDRLRQAVSFSRALQSDAWTIFHNRKSKEKYDFAQICRCYFGIGRSYDFWRSYLMIQDLPYRHFSYEELLSDPTPYIDTVAKHAGLTQALQYKTDLKVQRDTITDEWCERFLSDVKDKGFIESTAASSYPTRRLSNFIRLLKGKPLKPLPYVFR